MHEKLAQVKEKYEALSFREQILIAGSLLVALVVLWFLMLSEPLQLKTKQVSGELKTIEQNVQRLEQQQLKLVERRASDPHRDLKERITKFELKIQKVDAQLAEKFHGLIEPKMMASVLESILQKHGKLKLISVKSLESVPLLKGPELDDDNAAVDSESEQREQVKVYRHGMQIVFEGDYLATLAYLKNLESLDWEFYWDEVQLDITKYPQARIVITVHTLSLKDSWIGV